MPTLEFRHRLSCSPDEAWKDFLSPEHLRRVSYPLLSLSSEKPMPPAWRRGETVELKLKLLARVPWGGHRIHIRERDDALRLVVTEERGGPITRWDHRFLVKPAPGGCLCEDRIDFEAGAWNLFIHFYGRLLYRHRYARWKSVIRERR